MRDILLLPRDGGVILWLAGDNSPAIEKQQVLTNPCRNPGAFEVSSVLSNDGSRSNLCQN